ncbi:unnamed protein product [Moneuplotes crassus]|uniref:Uncharacterized protein n=1 Tax=Euplotes crassus TaxID=5936 RepID=A0AAD1UCK5_EUPCR|nr:unnamed protein product [Moneuplotes crassus]
MRPGQTSPLQHRKRREERKVELPDTFPEKVLEIESWIDKGEFIKEDLDELMLIYSQVVEYYNSINSDKASYYADRIQATLMKPNVLERMMLTSKDPQKLLQKDQEIISKRKQEKNMDHHQKSIKKAQEYNRKKKERSHQMTVREENKIKEKKQTLEKIIEETHKAEDTSVDQVAKDLIKQSTDLQKRLAERRRKKGFINSCKNANSKSFFRFESATLGNRFERENSSNMQNMSIIKREASDIEDDESFNMDIFNKLPDTTTSTFNITTKTPYVPPHKNLRIETSLSEEDEEDESEDELLEENLKDIWNQCENVFETIQVEKEEATNNFIEELTAKKFEKIAELKAEMKIRLSQTHDVKEQSLVKEEYMNMITTVEKDSQREKEEGLSDIKKRFFRRKKSIMGKLDYEGAKSKLKASLQSKNMSFISTPSSHSFTMSPFEESSKKATQAGGFVTKEYAIKPNNKNQLSPCFAPPKNMPKTPTRMVKIDFGLTAAPKSEFALK